MMKASKVFVNHSTANPGSVPAVMLKPGTYFTGDVNGYGFGLYLRHFSGVASLEPIGAHGFITFSPPETVDITNYQQVDVEITYTPCS